MKESVATSCRMSSIGNSGARSSGPTGCSVPGCSGGGGGAGRSGITLYHCCGISDSSSVIFVRSVTAASALKWNFCSAPYALIRGLWHATPASWGLWPAHPDQSPPGNGACGTQALLSRSPPGALKAPPSLLAPSSLVSPVGAGALWLAGSSPHQRLDRGGQLGHGLLGVGEVHAGLGVVVQLV